MASIRTLTDLSEKIVPKSSRERAVLTAASILAIVLLAIDQLTKVWADKVLKVNGPITVIEGFFDLSYVTNRGAAWGIFHGHTGFLLIVAAVVTALAIIYFRWLTEGYTERYYIFFIIISGVIGNGIDRLWRGEVVDFLAFTFWGYHFPTFNIADSAICVGVALYLLSAWLRPAPKKLAEESADEPA